MERMIKQLHGIEILGIPVGVALGFVLSVSVVKILKNLISKIPAIGNLISKAPLVVGFGLAYLVQLPAIKRFIGDDGADMISVASLFMGIEEQTRSMLGVALTDKIASLIPTGTTATAGAVSRPFIASPVSAPILSAPAEIGLGQVKTTMDVEKSIKLNM